MVKTFSVRHNVSVSLVEQQMEELRTRQMIYSIVNSIINVEGQFVAINNQMQILNRVFN